MSSTRFSHFRRPQVRVALSLLALLATSVVSACSSSSPAVSTVGASASTASTLRLGYFANLTHATAVLGVKDGYFAKALAGMEALSRNGLRYPFPPWGIQQDVRAGMAVSYSNV